MVDELGLRGALEALEELLMEEKFDAVCSRIVEVFSASVHYEDYGAGFPPINENHRMLLQFFAPFKKDPSLLGLGGEEIPSKLLLAQNILDRLIVLADEKNAGGDIVACLTEMEGVLGNVINENPA